MKRTLGFLLASFASLLAAAPGLAKVQVVTSLQDFASIADAVGGKRVETFALARGYQDPHFVEPKPSFVLKLSKADLLIVAGLELEIGYLPPLIDQSRNDEDPAGQPGLPRRLGGLRHPRAADGHRDPRDGRRASVRQPALLARPRERPRSSPGRSRRG